MEAQVKLLNSSSLNIESSVLQDNTEDFLNKAKYIPINFDISTSYRATVSFIKSAYSVSTGLEAYAVLLSLIKSCFDGGYWDNNKPWLNDTAWKN